VIYFGLLLNAHVTCADGRLMLTITHSVTSSLPLGSRNVRFLHIAFDSAGERFIAGDSQGNIFLFDIRGNKFDTVCFCDV